MTPTVLGPVVSGSPPQLDGPRSTDVNDVLVVPVTLVVLQTHGPSNPSQVN